MSEMEFARLVEEIYEVATDPSACKKFVERFKNTFNAEFMIVNASAHDCCEWAVLGDEDLHSEKAEGIALFDVFPALSLGIAEGECILSSEIAPIALFGKKFKANNEYHFAIVRIDEYSWIIIFRLLPAADFTADNKELLTSLGPHLKRASAIWQTLSTTMAYQQATMKSLDRLDYGCAFVNNRGQLKLQNKLFEHFIYSQVLSVVDGVLQFPSVEANKMMLELIAGFSGRGRADFDFQAHIINFTFQGDQFIVHCFPDISQDKPWEWSDDHVVAVVYINQVDKLILPSCKQLKKRWGLTKGEVQVLHQMMRGMSTKQVAEGLNVGSEAVRFHIKNIFRKTGVNRQAELISLVIRSFGRMTLSDG